MNQIPRGAPKSIKGTEIHRGGQNPQSGTEIIRQFSWDIDLGDLNLWETGATHRLLILNIMVHKMAQNFWEFEVFYSFFKIRSHELKVFSIPEPGFFVYNFYGKLLNWHRPGSRPFPRFSGIPTIFGPRPAAWGQHSEKPGQAAVLAF